MLAKGNVVATTLLKSYALLMHNRLETLADRAWYAWHCLPRDAKGRPPTQRSLSLGHKIPLGTLSKVFDGTRPEVERGTLKKMAAALQVPERWLYLGEGPRPIPTGPVPPRPGSKEALRAPDDQTGGTRLGDIPGWASVEMAARQREHNKDGWAFRGVRELVVQSPPDKLTPDYVIWRARIFRAEATPEQRDQMERLEIEEEKAANKKGIEKRMGAHRG